MRSVLFAAGRLASGFVPACRRREGIDGSRRSLNGRTAMIEIQCAKSAEFLAATGASRAAMQRHWHDVAVSCLTLSDRGRNRMDAAMGVREFHRNSRKTGVVV